MRKVMLFASVVMLAGCSQSVQPNGYWGAGDPNLNAAPVPPGQTRVYVPAPVDDRPVCRTSRPMGSFYQGYCGTRQQAAQQRPLTCRSQTVPGGVTKTTCY